MSDELTLATKIETGETLFDFIRRCGRIKPEHWNGYSCSRELYEKLVTPALVAHLLEGAAHLLIQADAARAQGPSTSGADEREEIARIIDRLESSDPDFDDCTDAANMLRAILARAQGPGEAVAWRTCGMSGDRWTPWVMCSEEKAKRWMSDPSFRNGRRKVEPLYAATPTREA